MDRPEWKLFLGVFIALTVGSIPLLIGIGIQFSYFVIPMTILWILVEYFMLKATFSDPGIIPRIVHFFLLLRKAKIRLRCQKMVFQEQEYLGVKSKCI